MVIMGQKTLQTGKGKVIKRTIAAAVFAVATTIGGCGQFPQCQVYFKGEVTRQCRGFLENIKKAKVELREVGEHKKYVRDMLRERVIKGNMEGVDTFNEVCKELEEVSAEIERFKLLETRVKRGEASDAELQGANEGILDIIEQLNEMGRKLVSI
ncbi:MAG: hypothetical protein GY852_03980 [bacterium]|nr:hypothetical protein [bacterium]